MDQKPYLSHQDSHGDADTFVTYDVPPVWCLDCHENLIVLGTGCGRLEIWDGFKGTLKVVKEPFIFPLLDYNTCATDNH